MEKYYHHARQPPAFISLDKGLFIWGETSHLGEILFIPRLHEKSSPPEWDTSPPSQPAYPFLSSYVTFIVYQYFHCLPIFCFYFNFELLIKIHTAKFYEMNCTFSRNLTILSRWDSPAKTGYMEENHPT